MQLSMSTTRGGISRAHLEMLRRQGKWLAKDLGSRNGSWLNGSPMAPYEAYPLEAGDCLQMAGSIYRFRVPSAPLRA
uniref:FHA domain-containing protein n=1 Tax=Cohnella rhizosphaerae TaxID=1457232 RepID=UPI003B8A819D